MAARNASGRRIYITGDREGAALRVILDGKPSNEDLRRWILLGHHYASCRGQDVHVSENLQVSVLQPRRSRPSRAPAFSEPVPSTGAVTAPVGVAEMASDAFADSPVPSEASGMPPATGFPFAPRSGLASGSSVVSQFMDLAELE